MVFPKHFRMEFLTLGQYAGWNNGHCWTMNEIYKMLPKDEVERVEKIEFLDEKELVSQLFDHYCVSYGWKNKSYRALYHFTVIQAALSK